MIRMQLKTVVLLWFLAARSLANLLISSVNLDNDTILVTTQYTFQIVRFGATSPIPSGTAVQISFPSAYTNSAISICTPSGWTGAGNLTCAFSQLKLTVQGGFPTSSNIQNFGIIASGIQNPTAAKIYSSFSVRLIFPDGTTQSGSGSYSVTITTALATCSMTLNSGLVFSEGSLTIAYQSQFINSNSIGYTMKLSMLQSYPSDPTNTDINPVLNVSSNMLATYLFEFSFTNSFTISMLMPPSTQPENNFIYIMTSNVLGDYDKCFLTIQGVPPNQFTKLKMYQQPVQSYGNLQIQLISVTPILVTDLIRISFQNTGFDISQVSNYATFTSGVLGQKQVTKAGNILTIRNMASYVIVSEVIFFLANVGFPYNVKPQQVTVYIETDSGFLRVLQVYPYVSLPGTLTNLTFACLTTEIGYSTSCTISVTLGNQINDTSYLQLKFPNGFSIVNGYVQCPTNGPNLNAISNCNSYAITNSIRVTGMIQGPATIQAGSRIEVTIPTFIIPNRPDIFSIGVGTFTQDGYTVGTSSVSFTSINRVLRSSEITIVSSSQVTSSITNYEVTLSLPLNLGIPYTLLLYLPFVNYTVPSVNGNMLASVYNISTGILNVSGVGNTPLTISGFLTYESTKPITLWGNLTYNNVVYFYFPGYDIAMTIPREISTFDFTQSNTIVGQSFRADIVMSGISTNDVIIIPTSYYALLQPNCSSNCQCNANGLVVVTAANNYGPGLTKISVNLMNNNYISVQTFNITTLSSSAVYLKQTKRVSINTQVTNVLNITSTQSNPYFLQNSVYTFNVAMTTTPPSGSINNFLVVAIPSQYSILEWSCIYGCVAPQPPPLSGTLYFSISSTVVGFTIKLKNPISFTSPILMTSTSLGDMDYGSYLPSAVCTSPCRSCDALNRSSCLSCYLWSSENKLRNGTCVSNCSTGEYYQNSSLSCMPCHNFCLSCVNTSVTCYTCKPGYLYFQMSCITSCPQSYYPSAAYVCEACEQNCISCTSQQNCTACDNGTYLYSASCWVSCQTGTYINPLINECLNCPDNCAECNQSGCTLCSNSYYLYNRLCYAQCPTGLFRSLNTCNPCQSPCAGCSVYSTNCTSCVTSVGSVNYYYLNNRCFQTQCPDTYYISPVQNICLQCQSPCLTCNRTHCLTCQTNLYFYRGFCSAQCQFGTYPYTLNYTCLVCPSQCQSCVSALTCLTCVAPYFLYGSACITTCPDGFYQNLRTCASCEQPCLTCSSLTACKSCTSLSYFNGTCITTCQSGYYSGLTTIMNQTVKQCTPCVLPCLTCNSASVCLSCSGSLKLYGSGCRTSCPDYYYDSSGICFACSYPCLTCNSSGCLTCANSSLYLQRQQCLSACSDLHPNNQTMKCQSCVYPCSTCTWSNTCLSCASDFIFYLGECIRTCPAGKYNNSQTCIDCPTLCSTCYLYNDQIRCPTCKPSNYFFGYDCIAICPAASSLHDPYCISDSCSSLSNCKTCSNLRCLECDTNYTLNSTTGKCELVATDGSVISAVSQIPVPFPFLIAAILIIICGFLLRLQFTKMFTPLFIYCFVGIAQCGVIALEVALIYVKGINSAPSGFVLKIVASAIAGVYVLFNIVGFLTYLKITRNDSKYRTWEKQDNKCASVAVSIIALIISFRFSLLKYSKLGHLQKFSATLSHDSKLSHQNLLSFMSIPLISLPLIVTSAWIAYLQLSMNYLFFTSIETSVLSVIMIILSIVQSLSPKNYTLEKKEQYKQGQDIDHIDSHSLSQMMMKLGVIQEQYHQNKQVVSEEHQVGHKNVLHQDDIEDRDAITSQALVFTKAEDQKMSIQSDFNNFSQQTSNYEESNSQSNTINLPVPDEKQQIEQLQNILMQAEQRAQSLNRPSRPIGIIKKQTRKELEYRDPSSSQQVESDDQPPPINSGVGTERRDSQSFGKGLQTEQVLDLNDLKSFLDVEERRLGMRRLQQLFEQIKLQQKQEQQLRDRLQRVTEEEKILKHKEYERARQLIERNQMNVEDKLSKVQKLLEVRNQNQKARKQKIEELEKTRKQQRSERAVKSTKRNLIYPINEQNIEQVVDQGLRKNGNSSPPQIQLKADVVWDEEPVLNFDTNNNWKITQERLSPQMKNRQQNHYTNILPESIQLQEPQQYVEIEHWPIDTELADKIRQVQSKAQFYIKRPKKALEVEQYKDVQLRSDSDFDQEVNKNGSQNITKFQQIQPEKESPPALETNSSKISKKRVNRNVFNLSPSQANKF